MRATIVLILAGCSGGSGEWVVETWGEEYIEDEIPAETFADGCSVRYDSFVVAFSARELVDGNGDVAGALAPDEAFDVHEAGPTAMGVVDVPADHYDTVRVVVAPGSAAGMDGQSVRAVGALTCGSVSAAFDWAFDESTTYTCGPPDLTIPTGGSDRTQLTVHGDHLFYDGLEDADAAVRGQAILDADADGNGDISMAELDAVSIPALGYGVGEYSDVLTLREFVSHLSRTLIHVDGEAECTVDF